MVCYTFTDRRFIRLFMYIWERRPTAQSLFYRVSQISESNAVMTCEDVRPIHTCPTASLMGTSLGYRSTITKQNVRAWSGEQNYHRGPESFACKSAGCDLQIICAWMTSREQGNLSVNGLRKCYWSRFRVWGPQFWKKSTSFLVHDNTPTRSDNTAAPPAEHGHGDRPSTRSRGPTFSYSLDCNPLLKWQFQEVE
jgi:hypothetical protein